MNNIYVETMPETCEECEFCEHFEKDAHGKGKHEVACYFNGFLTNALLGDTIDAKHCSHLKPLSDRLAEERKKLVQEIKEEFEPKNAIVLDEDKISSEAHLVNFGWDRCKEKLLKKLNQIERGE